MQRSQLSRNRDDLDETQKLGFDEPPGPPTDATVFDLLAPNREFFAPLHSGDA